MERFHCFFNWGSGVETMDLKEVNIVRAQAFERGIDLVEDGAAG
jgi:hypothetical protein